MPHALIAQQASGASITGTVLDIRGRVVQNAAVAVKSESSSYTGQLVTNDQGYFSAANLPAGTYDLTVTASGFAVTTKTAIVVAAGETKDVPVTLNVGSLSQNVVVEAIAGNSLAAQHALSQGSLDTEAPKSEI